MSGLSHVDESGSASMVDVTGKEITRRTAVARGQISMSEAAFAAVRDNTIKKGDVLGTARIAGIMAAKETPHLIPLCHPLLLTKVSVDLKSDEEKCSISCTCTATLEGKTGVEMEALTGVSVALLTIYDMCKAVDKSMTISDIRLIEKSGGKSGPFIREENENEK